VRIHYLLLLTACSAPLLEPERTHCLNSLECEAQERCIQQQCIRQDAGQAPDDAGTPCEDPDSDNAHTSGLMLTAEAHQLQRHVCPDQPDRYRHNPTGTVQVHAWAIANDGPAPKIHLVGRGGVLPGSCDNASHCAQGGRLTGLAAARVEGEFDLGILAPEGMLAGYEMGFRVGRTCSMGQDCGNAGRCVRPIAETTNNVGPEGVCVFPQDVEVPADCDRTDRSSEQPETAPSAGNLDTFRVDDVPLCHNDNDWYALALTEAGTVERQISVRSAAAADNELSSLNLFVGLYSADDLRPLRFNVAHFAHTAQAQTLRFADLAAGDYLLRITQINQRANPVTYTIKNSP
jgi:hypothetical protein